MTKTKVAVIGGGLGGMAAAFELTCTPALRDRYEVTVYQQGWRLGGKGASGRNPAMGDRIEEHGLHAFLGFYENAFRLMRDVYAERAAIDPTTRWKSWKSAFTPQRQVSIAEWIPETSQWDPWTIVLPRLPGEPGDGKDVPFLERLVAGAIGVLVDALKQLVLKEPVKFAVLGVAGLKIGAAALAPLPVDVRAALDSAEATLRAHEGSDTLSDDVRRLVLLVQLGIAIVRGIFDDILPRGVEEGFSYIDQWDFKAWLERNGASERVSFWGPVRALYDLGFAYEKGTGGADDAIAAAGVSLRVLLLLAFGYKDAPLWKMNAGMGDTIFAPVYEVLKARGVKFEFFRRVTDLGLSATGNLVDRITMSRQVDLTVPEYAPLVTVNDLPCWPSEPHWGQIAGGATLRAQLEAQGLTLENMWCQHTVGTETLHLGVDFDRVVLAVSVAALPDVAPALIAASDEWRRMLASSRTVQTQAIQVWFDRTTPELGWKDGTTILTGYVEPFDTWGDLSHLLPEETWPAPGPQSLAYLCNVMAPADPIPPYSDPTFPKTQKARVLAAGKTYLEQHGKVLWPKLGSGAGFDWSALHDASGATGPARLEAQYLRANVDPTERYVLSPPGSIDLRLRAGRSGFYNLVVAGDWVYTSINGGCAEAGVESGLRAAHALIGYAPRPFTDRHVHDDLTLAEGD